MDEKIQKKAIEVLKENFGDKWLSIAQSLGTEDLRRRVGKELTSFIAFPERGEGGINTWRGNCSPKVVEAVLKYVLDTKKYYGKDTSQFVLLDPMSGSGTSKFAADNLGVQSVLYDPKAPQGKGGWNALRDDVQDSADLIFLHPPYDRMITYSGSVWGTPHPDDLSRCDNYKDFIEKLNFVIKKLYMALRKDGRLAVLVGDIRQNGQFHSMATDMMKIGAFESFIVKAQHNCVSDNRKYSKPFIPITTEYLLLFHKEDIFLIPFSKTLSSTFDVSKRDDVTLTWHHLIRMTMEDMGGVSELKDLYEKLADHPKAQKNKHYKDRIRATIHEHKEQYLPCENGGYRLNYKVA